MTRARGTRGVSSVEVLVAAAISLAVIAALWGFFASQQRALATLDLYERSQAITRAAVDMLAREARMAAFDPTGLALTAAPGPSCPGARQGIVQATATRLRFRQDLNGDGVIGSAGEDVTWDLLGGAIRRTDGAGTPVVLASELASDALRFRYYDAGNPPVELVPGGSPAQLSSGQRDCLAKVRVTLRAQVATGIPAAEAHVAVVHSEIAIRNRSLTAF